MDRATDAPISSDTHLPVLRNHDLYEPSNQARNALGIVGSAAMTSSSQTSVRERMLVLLILLALAWLLWSGLFKPLLLALGVFSCLLTFFLVRRMGYFDKDLYALRLSFRLLGYVLWLGREVLLSSIQVARIVIDPRLPISPRVLEFRATAQHPADQVILGNSITLTPGTLTIDLFEGVIKVHALTEAGARDLMSGEMDRRVAELHAD